ncbi:adhesion G-protein coupled receptor G5-like [Poeciliopsis prolifica]|uniref:adhesion G-protein coupled receptor G5-like n=1 Tax=Poeciliopsis prolifica TaxID=188132 RepID=UPI0024142890|nr:adhesion G-protein coupled receptor G5-like [Poeciliopsis prolifica]
MKCFAIFILWWPTFIAFQVGCVENNSTGLINQSQIVACNNSLHQNGTKMTQCYILNTSPTTSSSTTTPLTTTDAALQTTSGTAHVQKVMEAVSSVFKNGSYDAKDIFRHLEILEQNLGDTDVNETTYLSSDSVNVLLYKNTDDFKGLEIQANNTEAKVNASVSNIKVKIRIPREFNLQKNDKVVFSMIKMANNTFKTAHSLYDHLLVGLSVAGKNFSGLQDRVNISIHRTTSLMKSQAPKCVFLNTTNNLTDFSTYGCETFWVNQPYITCSCDHLTYFAVLMVSADVSPKDTEILSYITYIGCGISLFALVVTVGLFITTKKLRADDSKKIHISLAAALILLNIHFLFSEAAAASSSTELCVYVALLLHYSLLASFTWMALEGFHLYLVLVKVFNIYVSRYLLKLSVVGWGLPAVIVTIMVITRKDAYGRAPLNVSNPNETAICYITNDTAKMVTTLGLFSAVFLFNMIMFGVTIKWYMGGNLNKQHGQRRHHEAKQEMCTLLTLMVLLGLTWCLIFFSFGHLDTAGLYSFCILNSLQGFFVSIYFVLSWKKSKEVELGTGKSSSETKSSSS